MLTLHHLNDSRSQRILWLLEELGTPYEMKRYQRNAQTRLAPPELMSVHPLGKSPVITDGDVRIAESGAIVDYIMARYGNGRLVLRPDDPDFAKFLYWFHFANGTLQAGMGRLMILNRLKLAEDNPMLLSIRARVDRAFDLVDTHLRDAEYLAGSTFTTADIMSVFSLTTMRYFQPYDLSRCPNVVKYLARISARPAYRRAMEKGDPGMVLLLS